MIESLPSVMSLVRESPKFAEQVGMHAATFGHVELLKNVMPFITMLNHEEKSFSKRTRSELFVAALKSGSVETVTSLMGYTGKSFQALNWDTKEGIQSILFSLSDPMLDFVCKNKFDIFIDVAVSLSSRTITKKMNVLQKRAYKREYPHQKPIPESRCVEIWSKYIGGVDERCGQNDPSALMYAVISENKAMIEPLLACGASPSLSCSWNGERTSPFLYSYESGDMELCNLLVAKMSSSEKQKVLRKYKKGEASALSNMEEFLLTSHASPCLPPIRRKGL